MLVPLVEWMGVNQPDKKLIYKDGQPKQIDFVMNVLPEVFARSYREFDGMRMKDVRVCGEHHSKSVPLPVFWINWGNIRLIMRNNFYDWKVTVFTVHNIPGLKDIDWRDIVYEGITEPVKHVYCEGFKKEDVHPPLSEYGDNYTEAFTVAISNDYKLYTFLWILRNLVEPLHWVAGEKKEQAREEFVQQLSPSGG